MLTDISNRYNDDFDFDFLYTLLYRNFCFYNNVHNFKDLAYIAFTDNPNSSKDSMCRH